MATRLKQEKVSQRFKNPLLLTGLGLTFGWALIMAITNLQMALSCAMSPSNCSLADGLSTAICLVPIYIGSVLVPVGVVFHERWPLITKVLVVIVAAPVLWYASRIVFSYLDILFHGLAPF